MKPITLISFSTSRILFNIRCMPSVRDPSHCRTKMRARSGQNDTAPTAGTGLAGKAQVRTSDSRSGDMLVSLVLVLTLVLMRIPQVLVLGTVRRSADA